jgi:hypothetical protein
MVPAQGWVCPYYSLHYLKILHAQNQNNCFNSNMNTKLPPLIDKLIALLMIGQKHGPYYKVLEVDQNVHFNQKNS